MLGCALFWSGAVFIALWWCRRNLNITAMTGMTMVMVIDIEMAAFHICEYPALDAKFPVRQALRQASVDRLRPIQAPPSMQGEDFDWDRRCQHSPPIVSHVILLPCPAFQSANEARYASTSLHTRCTIVPSPAPDWPR